MSDSNVILTFVEACCYVSPDLRCGQRDLWDSFDMWSKELGNLFIGRNSFYKRLSEYFPRDGTVFQRLTVKDPEEWEYWDRSELNRVYLIGDGEHVKIGISFDPNYRLNVLQIGSSRELNLLANFSGGLEEESSLHEHFKEKHIRGEWFKLSPEDILWIFSYFSY